MLDDEFYMHLAINEAWKFQILTYPNPPVGAVICDEFGKILSISSHKKAGFSHAELNAIQLALQSHNKNLIFPTKADEIYEFILHHHNNFFKNATIFVTLEPCAHHGKTPPCADLIAKLGFKRVVIAMKDENKIASGGAEILQKAGIKTDIGVLDNLAKELIEPFLRWSSGNFSFFKIATSINGVITGGKITGENSHILVHKIRDVISLLAIGGNSVRTDRPLLDSRLINAKAPDVFIYSRSNDFDRDIALFGVENRKVYIGDDINFIKKFPLCMIEGGENFIANLPEFVEYFLIFFAPNFLQRSNFKANLSLRTLFIDKIGDEFYGWFKRCK